jgi:hypothetical protein
VDELAVENLALLWLRDLCYTFWHDTLPKLISGQLRVPDAERFAAGTV